MPDQQNYQQQLLVHDQCERMKSIQENLQNLIYSFQKHTSPEFQRVNEETKKVLKLVNSFKAARHSAQLDLSSLFVGLQEMTQQMQQAVDCRHLEFSVKTLEPHLDSLLEKEKQCKTHIASLDSLYEQFISLKYDPPSTNLYSSLKKKEDEMKKHKLKQDQLEEEISTLKSKYIETRKNLLAKKEELQFANEDFKQKKTNFFSKMDSKLRKQKMYDTEEAIKMYEKEILKQTVEIKSKEEKQKGIEQETTVLSAQIDEQKSDIQRHQRDKEGIEKEVIDVASCLPGVGEAISGLRQLIKTVRVEHYLRRLRKVEEHSLDYEAVRYEIQRQYDNLTDEKKQELALDTQSDWYSDPEELGRFLAREMNPQDQQTFKRLRVCVKSGYLIDHGYPQDEVLDQVKQAIRQRFGRQRLPLQHKIREMDELIQQLDEKAQEIEQNQLNIRKQLCKTGSEPTMRGRLIEGQNILKVEKNAMAKGEYDLDELERLYAERGIIDEKYLTILQEQLRKIQRLEENASKLKELVDVMRSSLEKDIGQMDSSKRQELTKKYEVNLKTQHSLKEQRERARKQREEGQEGVDSLFKEEEAEQDKAKEIVIRIRENIRDGLNQIKVLALKNRLSLAIKDIREGVIMPYRVFETGRPLFVQESPL